MKIYSIAKTFISLLCLIKGQQSVKLLLKTGDVTVGGLFPIHKKSNETENACGEFSLQPGYQYMIAMLYALEQINNNSALLRNISLGTRIYDTCQSTTIGGDRARDFIKETLLPNRPPLVAVVGPFSSDVSIATASLLRVFGIPQISYGSSSPVLSNKELYGNFFRTVPPDSFQADAIVDILRHFGWKYIVTVNSKGNFGEKAFEELQIAMENTEICIAKSRSLPYLPHTNDYMDIIKDFQQEEKVNIIVIFTTQVDSRGLLHAALSLKATRFTWLGSSGWSNRMDVILGNEQVANGSITVNHLGGEVKGFQEYYNSISTHNSTPWGTVYFKKFLKCNATNIYKSNCFLENTLPIMEMSPARVVFNAIYSLAHALDDMQRILCPGEDGLCDAMRVGLGKVELVGFLKNTSFPDAVSGIDLQFNKNQEMDGNYSIMNFQQISNGNWDYVNVGEWGVKFKDDDIVKKTFRIDTDMVSWGNAQSRPPVSLCSRVCVFPLIKKPHGSDSKCCWDCINCKNNEIVFNDSCQSCPEGYRPTANLKMCKMIPVVYPNFETRSGIISVVLSALGIISTAVTAAFFLQVSQ